MSGSDSAQNLRIMCEEKYQGCPYQKHNGFQCTLQRLGKPTAKVLQMHLTVQT